MKFLEKDLEDIIYNNAKACYDRGLKMGTPGRTGILMRQVKLGDYGVADMIAIEVNLQPVYAPWEESFHREVILTIIECKLNEVNVSTYLQAKRYKAALTQILQFYSLDNTDITINTVLIGQTVDVNSDFIFQYQDDKDCTIFTFTYGIDGIHFEEVDKNWVKGDGANDDMCYRAEASLLRVFKDAIVNKWNKDLPVELHHPHKK